MITFRYKEESLGLLKGKILRPVADVFVQTKQGQYIEFHPYIDSGADVTLLPLSFGKLIGLSTQNHKIHPLGGISGRISMIRTSVQFRIGAKQFLAPVAWAMTEDVPPLLGREGVFDNFHITFKQNEKIVVFD